MTLNKILNHLPGCFHLALYTQILKNSSYRSMPVGGANPDSLNPDLWMVYQLFVSSKRNDIFILALYTRPSTIIEILTPSMQM